MPTIYIDNKPFEVKDGQNLLHAVLSLGKDLPYFCWHPELGSVGACRQCAVTQYNDEEDTTGRIVMACMTPVQDGARISIEDSEAQQFRANVIEWLMVNHPHDCPVCDEGGECHLQDMTVMSGHNYREFRFKKRTHRNQYLGPFINHEMNRCIACYRCVRYYRDYTGGDDLFAFAAHDHIYFGRHEDGVLESEFSGNLVEICPTGVFTDKTLKRHYTRKWDLQSAPSVCHHCGLGCNTVPGERYGTLRRILNRYNSKVNGYFLCDRGRFGYEFVNSEKRIREPLMRAQGSTETEQISKDGILEQIAGLISSKNNVIGVGSPRASLESNYTLRSLVGKDKFFSGMSKAETGLVNKILNVYQNGTARVASIQDVAEADAVFVLGEDLTNTAPLLDLAIKQAIRNQPIKEAEKYGIPEWHDAAVREWAQEKKGPLFIAAPIKTKLDRYAQATYNGTPQDIARLGYAVAHLLDEEAPEVELSDELRALAQAIAKELKGAEKPVIIAGTSLRDESILEAAANVAWALNSLDKQAEICYTVPEPNSLGAGLFDSPDFEAAMDAVLNGEAETIIVLENDLYRRADRDKVTQFFEKATNIISVDHLENETTDKAGFILPAASFAEGDGTLINNEARAQRYFQVFIQENTSIQESWRWLRDILVRDGQNDFKSWHSLDDVFNAVCKNVQFFIGKKEVAPDSQFRIHDQKIPRSSARYSGRTAMKANINIHEQKPPEDPDSPLAFSMEGFSGRQPSNLVSFFWAPGWNSVQSTNKYQQEIGGELRGGDPGVRLIEPRLNVETKYFKNVPESFAADPDKWFIIPLYHIFGSDEVSAVSEGLSHRVPNPYIALKPSDAEKLSLTMDEKVSFTIGEREYNLSIKLHDNLPDGVAGLPVGLQELIGIELPLWTTLSGVSE